LCVNKHQFKLQAALGPKLYKKTYRTFLKHTVENLPWGYLLFNSIYAMFRSFSKIR